MNMDSLVWLSCKQFNKLECHVNQVIKRYHTHVCYANAIGQQIYCLLHYFASFKHNLLGFGIVKRLNDCYMCHIYQRVLTRYLKNYFVANIIHIWHTFTRICNRDHTHSYLYSTVIHASLRIWRKIYIKTNIRSVGFVHICSNYAATVAQAQCH